MKFDLKDMSDSRIKNVCDDWDDEFDGMPLTTGVFVFVDAQHDVKYVGWALDGHLKSAAEKAYNEGRGKGATLVGWARCFNSEKSKTLAGDWIKKYGPPNNK